MTLDDIKHFLGEHFTNYAVVVIDEDSDCLEYRYSNELVGKMLFGEAYKDMVSYEVNCEVVWEEEEDTE